MFLNLKWAYGPKTFLKTLHNLSAGLSQGVGQLFETKLGFNSI